MLTPASSYEIITEKELEEDTMSEIGHSPTLKFEGKIIVAEDQLINLEVIKSYTERLGILNFTDFCIDGQ